MIIVEKNTLHSWLKGVSSELADRRLEMRGTPRPKRNRERERARREARQLFVAYANDRAMSDFTTH